LPIRGVTERLRGLSPPLKYSAYVVGAFLMLFAAVAMGAAAAFVVGVGGAERVARNSGGPAESGTLEGTSVEKTANDADETNSDNANSDNANSDNTAFVHRATDGNSRGDYTYLSDPRINGDPNAVVLVTLTPDQGSASAAAYAHNIGVWYEGAEKKKWAIFNQDRAAVPAGATFEVEIPPASERFVHSAEPDNTVGNTTYLDDPLTNGHPGAVLSVTQNWNPGGGGRGVYNDHPVGVLYDEDVQKWALYNLDGAPIPVGAAFGAAFNVAVSEGDESAR
jgi:hypothetical protein